MAVDSDDRVGGLFDARIRNLVDTDVFPSVPRQCLHCWACLRSSCLFRPAYPMADDENKAPGGCPGPSQHAGHNTNG